MSEESKPLEHYKLFVETNRSFIDEKFKEMFRVELLADEPHMGTVNQNKL